MNTGRCTHIDVYMCRGCVEGEDGPDRGATRPSSRCQSTGKVLPPINFDFAPFAL